MDTTDAAILDWIVERSGEIGPLLEQLGPYGVVILLIVVGYRVWSKRQR